MSLWNTFRGWFTLNQDVHDASSSDEDEDEILVQGAVQGQHDVETDMDEDDIFVGGGGGVMDVNGNVVPDVGGQGDGLVFHEQNEIIDANLMIFNFNIVQVHQIGGFASTSWQHFEAALIYMLMHAMTFCTILSMGFTILQCGSITPGFGIHVFWSPVTYFIGFLYIIVARGFADYFEYNYVDWSYANEIHGSRFWKHVPFVCGVIIAVSAFVSVVNGFNDKYTILTIGGDRYRPEYSGLYILSVLYLLYFATTICLMDARPTPLQIQILQGGLNTLLAANIVKLGGNCAILIMINSSSRSTVMAGLALSVIFLTTCFIILYYQLLHNLRQKDGSKMIELMWSFVVANSLIQLYLGLNIYNLGMFTYRFYGSIAFSMTIFVKLILSHYWVEQPRPHLFPIGVNF